MKKLKNNYLLVDYGNTNIKIGIYDKEKNKIIEIHFNHKDEPLSFLFKQFNKSNIKNIQKIFVVSTVSKDRLKQLLKYLFESFRINAKVLCKNDFNGLLNLSNINKKVNIGNDILLLGLYGSTMLPKSAIFNFGTVYSCVIMKGNKFESTLLIPNMTLAIDDVSKKSSIDKKLLPKLFNKTQGLNTPDCFAAGANLTIEGLVDNVSKTYKLNKNNILISGGDAKKYLNINNKYKVIDHLTLIALSYLIKEKC